MEDERPTPFLGLVRRKLGQYFSLGEPAPEKSTEIRIQEPGLGFSGFFQSWKDLYADLMGEGQSRAEKYDQYLYLDKNLAEAAATLNVYSDNVVSGTVGGEENYYVEIDEDESNVDELEEIVSHAEKQTNIKDQVWDISRNLTRDGDEFEEVVLGDLGQGYGLELLKLKKLPVKEIEANIDERGALRDAKIPYRQRPAGSSKFVPLDWWRIIHFKVGNDVYGIDKSIFANASLRIGRQLIWVDEALVLARMSRAWLRFAWMIDTGKLSPDDAFAYVQKFMNRLKEKRVISDKTTGKTSVIDAPLLPDEDVGIPVGENSKADVKPLTGDTNLSNIGDVQYLQNKFLMACTMPKAYVSLEEGVNAKATIGQLDVQFARQVRRRQQSLKPGLRKFYELVFILAGKDPDSFKWDIVFPELATTDEMMKWEMLNLKAGIAKQLAVDIGVVNNDYVMRELLDFDDEMVQKYGQTLTAPKTPTPPPGTPGATGLPGMEVPPGGGQAQTVQLPPETASMALKDPQVRAILCDLKDIVASKLMRDKAIENKKKVGVACPVCKDRKNGTRV